MNYRDEYKNYQRETFWTLPRFLFALLIIALGFGLLSYFLGFVGNTAKTVEKEFFPSTLLSKYEWFKDAAAALDKKQADIQVYDRRLKELSVSYSGVKRNQWARDDREQYSIWMSEEAGVKASYNQLAAEYNAQMAKFNYRFTNVGDLPQGSDRPLPRAFKPYINE